MKHEKENLCLNCQNELVGRYCHHCGQKKEVARITWKSLIDELTSKWFGWDNKFFHTVKGLTIAPGKTVRAYLDGNRVRFVGPVGYFFLMTLIFLLTYDIFNIDLTNLMEEISITGQPNLSQDVDQNRLMMVRKVNELLTSHYRKILLAGTPFLSLASMIFYRRTKRKFNFLENIVFFFYIPSHSLWFSILLDGPLIYFDVNPLSITPMLSIFYYIYALYTFQDKKGFWGIIISVLTIVFGYVIYSIIGAILGVFYFQLVSTGA